MAITPCCSASNFKSVTVTWSIACSRYIMRSLRLHRYEDTTAIWQSYAIMFPSNTAQADLTYVKRLGRLCSFVMRRHWQLSHECSVVLNTIYWCAEMRPQACNNSHRGNEPAVPRLLTTVQQQWGAARITLSSTFAYLGIISQPCRPLQWGKQRYHCSQPRTHSKVGHKTRLLHPTHLIMFLHSCWLWPLDHLVCSANASHVQATLSAIHRLVDRASLQPHTPIGQ